LRLARLKDLGEEAVSPKPNLKQGFSLQREHPVAADHDLLATVRRKTGHVAP
jgi:hypothetical protein